MNYPVRAGVVHGLLFVLVTGAFILPVVFGSAALLPVPFAAWASVILAVLALVDASYHAFSPTQRPTRGLRVLSVLAAVALIAGWVLWMMIYNTFDKPLGTEYRVGTFLLGMSTVLNAFCIAIACIRR